MSGTMPPVNFERLRDRRDELDLSNTELAELVGMSKGYVENILYGADEPSRRVMYRLSRALDLSMEDIQVSAPKDDPPEQPPPQPETPKTDPLGPPPRRNGRDNQRGPRRAAESARRSA